MKILLIFTCCLISDGGVAVEVTGYSGGRILIKCTYDTQYTQNKKYFCKDSGSNCSDLIKTEDKDMWINSGRFSLFDDTKSAEFRVMIRNLTVQDTGTYQCGVDIDSWIDSYTPVELNVKEDLTYKKFISETVHVGGDLNVSCEYPKSLRSKPKFFCQMKQEPDVCSYKVSVNESSKYVKMGKFSLYDDRTKHIFSVSMRNISEEDSGVYWCGAEADWNSDHGYKVYFTQFNVTLTGFPASTVITVSVILLLFVIGIIVLIVILLKDTRMKVNLAVCDSEEENCAESLTCTTVTFYSNTTSSNAAVPSVNDEELCDFTSVSYTALCG